MQVRVLEVIQALRRLARQKLVTDLDAKSAIDAMSAGRLAHHPIDPLIDRVWELRHNLTAYNASYLALAKTLNDSILVTGDGGLAETAIQSLGAGRVRRVL